jgi:hypothetical protein
VPAAIGATFVAAHYPHRAKADQRICANRASVLARWVDREAMVSALREEPFRSEPQRSWSQPLALVLGRQKDVQAGLAVVGIGLLVVSKPPSQRTVDFDRKRSAVVVKTLARVLGIIE